MTQAEENKAMIEIRDVVLRALAAIAEGLIKVMVFAGIIITSVATVLALTLLIMAIVQIAPVIAAVLFIGMVFSGGGCCC